MTLTPSTRLGPYEIVAPLGAGGMGEVWRASDPRLGRDVAIKALPEGFERDPERLARFEREARLLASLNHPNVAGIYGVEEVDGHRYLVLELVDGESLSARLAQGPLPVDEALEVCRQIAAGVEAAHEAGVVHRDLKPGNVMLRSDGSVKVLDFGLAKSDSADRSGSDLSLSASPTMTAAATSAGVLLGTAAYMSPEQARGRAVDKRSDVWSFGCVLYECLTARQAFRGETVSDTIAAILKTEADLATLPADTPDRVRELLARCLCKDARERLRDIGEARVLLGSVRAGGEPAPAGAIPARPRSVPLGLAAGGAIALAALAAMVTLVVNPKPAPAPLRKLDLVADDVGVHWYEAPQLSPDGSRIAYVAKGQLWVRDLDQLEPRRVADVAGMSTLCWSPDSRELAFDNRKKVWKVTVSGGVPVPLCDIPGTGSTIGMTWSARGIVALSVWRAGIYTVPAAGGSATLLLDIDPQQIVDFHNPSWLANGDLLYVVHWVGRGDTTSSHPHDLEVLAGGKRFPVEGLVGNEAQPTCTASGKLLYVRRGTNAGVWSIGYDERGRRTTGQPRLVAAGAVSVSASNDGALLFMESDDTRRDVELVWVDRSGKFLAPTGAAYPALSGAELSPDGRRVVFAAVQDGVLAVWVRDFERHIDTRVTFSKIDDFNPHWLGPNRLSYSEIDGTRDMHSQLLTVNADGSGGRSVLATAVGSSSQAACLSPDGRTALRTIDEVGHGRLRLSQVLPDGSLGPPTPFVHFTPEPDVNGLGLDGNGATLSPSGRLVAYSSNDEQPEVFLTRFPGGEGPWQVSSEGGRRPRWGSGRLYYVAGSGPARRWLVEVTIDPTRDPPVGRSTRLFDLTSPGSQTMSSLSYDVSARGERFLMSREVAGASGPKARMVLVQNWESEFSKESDRQP
jgi:dipeptidyl aminopeptidase/acylaminoacyl peptidase